MKRASFVVSGTALALGATPAVAQSNLTSVSLGLTSKTANEWAEYVSDELGFFAQNGLKIEFVYTGSAAAGAQQLAAGSLDISEVSSTQGIEAIQGGAPFTFVCEHGTKVPYLLLGKKGITSLAALKGKTIIVGGPNDITRVFMDKVLALANLKPDDYVYTYAGATTERFAALANGGVDAAILFPPFAQRAAGMGYPVLADITKFFPSFLFDGFAVKPDWAKAHSDLVVRFIKAYILGVRWLYDPANKARAIQILTTVTGTQPTDAQQTYDIFVTNLKAYSTTGLSSPGSVGPVIDALVKIGAVTPPIPPPTKFYDNTYANQANAQLRR
jgi:ABC-type nitrate/sulfonate/bicarbonate transport system substrate-binding protein